MARKIALLLIHGMGEQQPHELTGLFVRNLTDSYVNARRLVTTRHRIVTTRHRVEPGKDSESPESNVRVDIESHVRMDIVSLPDQPDLPDNDIGRIDVHEVYWADKPQGLIKLKEVGKWLLRTSLTPLRRWPQNASLFHKPDHPVWRAVLLFGREVVLAVLLLLLGVSLLIFTLNAAGLTDDYIRLMREELQKAALSTGTYVAGATFLVALATGVFLLWGSFRIFRTVGYERNLAAAADLYNSRWAWLSRWSLGSLLVGLGLLAATWPLYRQAGVAELLALILRIDEQPFRLVISAAILLFAAVLGFGWLIWGLWRLAWDGWRRTARVVGALVGLAAVICVPIILISIWKQPAKVVFWGILLGGAALLSKFLVASLGDVAIYFDGIDERSKHYETREAIITAATQKLAGLLKSPDHDEVFVAAHSLGSVIAYDAINRLATGRRAAVEETGASLVTEAEFDQLRGFYSFGSPLDKVVYLFHKTPKSGTPVLSQIQSSLTSFRRLPSGRPYGQYTFEPYIPQVPEHFRWRNAWSRGDILGHKLDFYDIDMGQPHFDYIPLVSHTSYWKDPDFYEDVRMFLSGDAAPT